VAPTGWTAVTETMCFGEGLTKVINCLEVMGATSWEAGKVMIYVTEDGGKIAPTVSARS